MDDKVEILDTATVAEAGEEHRILTEAAKSGSWKLLEDSISWYVSVRHHRGYTEEAIARELEAIQEFRSAKRRFEASEASQVASQRRTNSTPSAAPVRNEDLSAEYLEYNLAGDRKAASKLLMDSYKSGVSLREIYLDVFQRSQRELGRLWQENKISVAQEHYCTASTQLIMSQFYPYLFALPRIGRSMVATAVRGDRHEVGLRIVSDFFEIEGWDTYYLGADVPDESVIRSIIERKAELLAISATMVYSIKRVRTLVATVRANAQTAGVRILVGGYPFNVDSDLWRSVGADASAADAEGAVRIATA